MTISTDTVRTRAVAILTIAVAGVALTGCSLLGNIPNGGSGDNGAPETTDGAEGTDTGVFDVQVGDCLNDGDINGEVSEVKVIDCASEHDSEAYESIQIADGDYPGDTALQDQAETECTTAFTSFIDMDYQTSSLDISFFFPTEETWAQGDREILCFVADPSGKTTGTLEGAAL